ncbi:MFS transporter [Burkholderia sp. 22PA0106]|uniref:MFS transporter n=1 Tax=Burkholderia sp. 22PA0106 TaxID=3237371 RepID=UPI0039C23C1A
MTAVTHGHLRNLGLASLGAVLEYFDFIVYVYVAAAIGHAFFPPQSSAWVSALQTFGIYAIGYLVRPVAGVLIAHFSDRVGRKKLFLFTVLLMSVPTFLMGLLPTYAMVGWLAPAALLLLRILQGCAVGGELPGASVFIAEHAPAHRLGLHSGIFFAVVNCGLLLGAGAAKLAALIATQFPGHPDLQWRLPFMLGGAFGLLSAYLRRSLDESPEFAKARKAAGRSDKVPFLEVAVNHKAACAIALAMVFVMAMSTNVFFQWLPNHLITQWKLPRDTVFSANVAGVLAFVIGIPAWGWLSDRIGWARNLVGGALVGGACAVWFFHRIEGADAAGALLPAFMVIGVAIGSMHSAMPGLIASLYPTPVRQTGFTVPYSLGTAFISGPTPLALTWLVREFGMNAALCAYLAACLTMLVIARVLRHTPLHLGRVRSAAMPAEIRPAAGHR